jgi:hypothetical protein
MMQPLFNWLSRLEIAIDQGLISKKSINLYLFINHLSSLLNLLVSRADCLVWRLICIVADCGLACRPLDTLVWFFGTAFSLVDFLILQTVTFFGYSALLWKAVLVFLLTCSVLCGRLCPLPCWLPVLLSCGRLCPLPCWLPVLLSCGRLCSLPCWLITLLPSEDRACCLDGALFLLHFSSWRPPNRGSWSFEHSTFICTIVPSISSISLYDE